MREFDSVLAPLENDEWLQFIAHEDRGETIDDAYLSIHAAMASYGQKKMEVYEDVEVNIWLMKGVHHYIYCFDEASLEADAYIMDYYTNYFDIYSDYVDMAILCSDQDETNAGFEWVWNTDTEEWEYKYYSYALS